MKLFVPEIGEELKLAKDWHFNTIGESRNDSLFDAFGVPPERRWQPIGQSGNRDYWNDGFNHWRPNPIGFDFMLPAGTVLKVDRVYIRKGQAEYSSMTFVVMGAADPNLMTKKNGGFAKKAIRFWVKLQATRDMDVEMP